MTDHKVKKIAELKNDIKSLQEQLKQVEEFLLNGGNPEQFKNDKHE